MIQKNLFWPLTSAVLLGVIIGACSRPTAQTGPNPDSSALENVAAAQTAPIRNASELRHLSATYADIAQHVTPAVVNINSQQTIPGRVLRDPFGGMFGGGGEIFQEPDQHAQSLGSGVIVDKRGIIITNNHVIQNASSITVTLNDRRRYAAKLLGTDPAADIATLKIQATNLPVLQWADSDKLKVGDIVLAIGSPFNLASTVTQGIISAKGRHDLGISAYEDFLQTDAAINPGNSGGALVDIDGNLVGINTAILSESGGNQGIGLAIPANLARKIGGQLTASGRVTRGWLGLIVQAVTADVAQRLGLPDTSGVLVTNAYPSGPAANLAWSSNSANVLTKVNGQPIDSPGQLRNLIADLAPGTKLSLEIWQGGQTHTFSVVIGNRPPRAQGV